MNALKSMTKIFIAGVVFGAGTTYGASLAEKYRLRLVKGNY